MPHPCRTSDTDIFLSLQSPHNGAHIHLHSFVFQREWSDSALFSVLCIVGLGIDRGLALSVDVLIGILAIGFRFDSVHAYQLSFR